VGDYGVFESINGSEGERKIATRETQRKLDAAIDDVKRQYGAFLFASRDGEEWNDRVALCKNDMLKTIDAHIVPVTGVVRRIVKACKDEWRFKVADKTGPAMDNDVTFAPKKDKDLKPKGDFDAYLNKVDQNSDEVENCFKEGYRYAENDMAGGGGWTESPTMSSELGTGGPIADPSGQAPNVSPMSIPGIQARRNFYAETETYDPYENNWEAADQPNPLTGYMNAWEGLRESLGGGDDDDKGFNPDGYPVTQEQVNSVGGGDGTLGFGLNSAPPEQVSNTGTGGTGTGTGGGGTGTGGGGTGTGGGGTGGGNTGGTGGGNTGGTGGGNTGGGGSGWQENNLTDAINTQKYTVQDGDTLSDIAQRSGWGENYKGLGEAAGIQDVDKIDTGQEIDLGKPKGVDGGNDSRDLSTAGGKWGAPAAQSADAAKAAMDSFNSAPAPAPAAPAPAPAPGPAPTPAPSAGTEIKSSLALNQYMDWCDSFGARRASVKNLDIYAQNLNDQAYFEIASALTDPGSPIYRVAAPGSGEGTSSTGGGTPSTGGGSSSSPPTWMNEFPATRGQDVGSQGLIGGGPPLYGENGAYFGNGGDGYVPPAPSAFGNGGDGLDRGITQYDGQYMGVPGTSGFKGAGRGELIQVDPDLAKMRMDQRAQQGGRSLPMDGIAGPGKSSPMVHEKPTSIDPDMLKALMAQSQNIVTGARMRTAAPDYLQKADEALTNLLNQKAEEFQQTIAPLQQALQTVQQAEAAQQAMNPMGVQPPAGTVNVLPPAPGAEAGGGDPMAGGGGMDPSMMGMDPSMMGGDPAAMMGGGGAPPMDPSQMQMQARRKRVNRGKARGANAPHHAGIVDEVDEWGKQRGVTTGNPDIDMAQFQSETGKSIGPKQKNKLTKPKPTSTANPMPKSKQPISTKHASFFTRKVAGWEWDDHLNGYLASKPTPFTCKCGSKHPVPSYSTCKCGKIYNSYVIGTGGDHHQASVEKFICREIPVRDNVIVAARRRDDEPIIKYTEDDEEAGPRNGSCRKKSAEKVKRHKLTDPGPLGGGKDDKMPSISEELGEDWYKRGPGGKYAKGNRRSR
jgi:hypothetical protein